MRCRGLIEMRGRMSIYFITTYQDIPEVGPDMIPEHPNRCLPKDVVLAWHFVRHRHGTQLVAPLTSPSPSGQMAITGASGQDNSRYSKGHT